MNNEVGTGRAPLWIGSLAGQEQRDYFAHNSELFNRASLECNLRRIPPRIGQRLRRVARISWAQRRHDFASVVRGTEGDSTESPGQVITMSKGDGQCFGEIAPESTRRQERLSGRRPDGEYERARKLLERTTKGPERNPPPQPAFKGVTQ